MPGSPNVKWMMLNGEPLANEHLTHTSHVHWGAVYISTSGSDTFGYHVGIGTDPDGQDECFPILKKSGVYAVTMWFQTSDLNYTANNPNFFWDFAFIMDLNSPGSVTYPGSSDDFIIPGYSGSLEQIGQWRTVHGSANFSYSWCRVLPIQLSAPVTLGAPTLTYTDMTSPPGTPNIDENWRVDLYIVKLDGEGNIIPMNFQPIEEFQ